MYYTLLLTEKINCINVCVLYNVVELFF